MKKFKKAILSMLCVAVVLGTTACGSRNNAGDDAANDTQTEQNGSGNMAGDTNGGGAINDLGNAVGNGMEDMGQGVKDMTDDAINSNDGMTSDSTGNNDGMTSDSAGNNNDMTNDATNGRENHNNNN